MRFYRRLLSLLLVFVLLFVVFSTEVSASSNILDNTFVRYSVCNKDYAYCFSSSFVDANIKNGGVNGGVEGSFLTSRADRVYHLIEFSNTQNWNSVGSEPLFKKGSSFTLGLYDILLGVGHNGSYVFYPKVTRENIRLEVFSQNGQQKSYYFSPDKGNLTFSNAHVNITDLIATDLPFDVYKYRVVIPLYSADYFNLNTPTNGNSLYDYLSGVSTSVLQTTTFFYYGIGVNYDSSIRIDTESTDTGLLKGIINWLKEIKNGITNLPSLIWGAIEGGLRGLLVPSSEYFSNYGERWDALLSGRFGAIYQVGAKLVEFGQDLLNISKVDVIDSLEFPVWTFNVGGTTFNFGGWDVPIRVDKFGFLYTASQTAFGIVGTFLFMKGLRKRYDEVMGVEQ